MDSPLDSQTNKKRVVRIGFQNIFALLWIGTAGQIAWAVENSWFNTFVFDRITTDPQPVAWMVAVSAVTAMFTTLFMGILSDRTHGKWGMRKPYIVFGYILWGIITAIYPMIEWVQNVGIAVVFVIITDAVMTFFGSTSNDAAYNAWLKDISHSSNRNRIQSLVNITGYLANAIAIVAAGVVIDKFGYFIFFYVLGGFVTLTGLIAVFLVPSAPIKRTELNNKQSYIKELKSLFKLSLLKENSTLFLLFLNMAITGIASQVYMPYLLIFLEHYVGFSKTELSGYMAVFIFVLIGAFLIIGALSHKANRKPLVLWGSIIGSIVTIIMGVVSFNTALITSVKATVFILYFLATIPAITASIAHGGWLLDKYPEGDVGKFQGIRMLFMVLIPMVTGPFIGAAAIDKWGITVGIVSDIPTPHIFIIGGIISILAVIPILFIRKSEGKIDFD